MTAFDLPEEFYIPSNPYRRKWTEDLVWDPNDSFKRAREKIDVRRSQLQEEAEDRKRYRCVFTLDYS
jgi:hypothetical protein